MMSVLLLVGAWPSGIVNKGHSRWLPVAWLHPPKTGSSFGLTVMRHACTGIPSDSSVGCGPPISDLARIAEPLRERCAGGFTSLERVNGHSPANMSEDYGRLVTMFRDRRGIRTPSLPISSQVPSTT